MRRPIFSRRHTLSLLGSCFAAIPLSRLLGTSSERTLSTHPQVDTSNVSAFMTGDQGAEVPAISPSATMLPSGGRTVVTLTDYLNNNKRYNVKDFGAKGDGVFDNTPVVQGLIGRLEAEGGQELYFPMGIYYFATPVILSTLYKSFRFTGDSLAFQTAGISQAVAATRFIGASGSESIFKITSNFVSLEFDHLAFDGQNIATGVVSAIKNVGEGVPSRPTNIHHCTFANFEKAIWSKLTALTTGLCNLHINHNVFFVNNYALYGSGGAGSIMNLDFSDNVSERGGKIKIEADGAASGGLLIANNLMEGQTDSIDIAGGLCMAEIVRNYFEVNSGILIKFVATNPNSRLRLGPNYIINSPTARITIDNCYLESVDDFPHIVNRLRGRSKFWGHAVVVIANMNNALDMDMVRDQVAPPAAIGGTLFRMGSSIVETPLGPRSISAPFATQSSLYTITGSFAVNDYVIVTALIKADTATEVGAILYDHTARQINEVDNVTLQPKGQFTLVFMAIKALAIATAFFGIRFKVPAGQIAQVTDFYAYSVRPVGGEATAYPYLPRIGARGRVQIALNAASVVVNHGMLVTPENFQVTPRLDLGSYWVTDPTPTQFTINCSSAEHPGGEIDWQAE